MTATTVNRNLTTMSTAGLLLPIASASSSVGSGRLEDGPGQYEHRNPSLPFSQSQSQPQPLVSPHPLPQAQLQSQQLQSQPVSEAPSLSERSPFLPQDTAQRILGTTSNISPTTTTGGGNENVDLRWGGSRPESGDSGVEAQHAQSQSQGQQKMSRQEALAQILEYHREGLTRSMERKNGSDGGRAECRGRDEDGDEDERWKRKRRDSDVELNRHGAGKAYTSSSTTQQQQTCRQPPAFLSSSASAGPSASTSSSAPWSSSTMTNNKNTSDDNTLSFVRFGQDDDDSSSPSSSSLMTNVNEGLQVYTVGHLMPRDKFANEDNWSFDANGFSGGGSASTNASSRGDFMYEPTAAASETVGPLGGNGNEDDEDVEIVPPGMLTTGPPPSTPTVSSTTATPLPPASSLLPPPSPLSSSSSQQKLRVRRATFVPGGWAVPPRVLLVDDDAVIRKLSSKFLKIFGCTTDVAVDGIGAVTKMNLEKYDLVLMVNLFLLSPQFGAENFSSGYLDA